MTDETTPQAIPPTRTSPRAEQQLAPANSPASPPASPTPHREQQPARRSRPASSSPSAAGPAVTRATPRPWRHVVYRFLALFVLLVACDSGSKPAPEVKREPPIGEKLRADLQMAHIDIGEGAACHSGVDGSTTYIVCRYGLGDDGASVWYVDAPFVRAMNGDALQMVARLGKPWIVEAPRPLPSGVDIETAKRVTP